MKTTKQWLDAVKARHQIESDYALSKLLDVSRQHVSNWQLGNNTLSDYAALKVAEALEVDPLEVIAAVNAERAKRAEERHAWEKLAKRLASAATVLLALLFFGSNDQAKAEKYQEKHVVSYVYYVK